jgi:hypothetical protein
VATRHGYQFAFPTHAAALRDVLGKGSTEY